ncbi:MAG: hypothetical protein MUC38_02065 [Cyclobacteriaceae bacterium]|jgi:hypothetical protein|nr:hypothetical protein [Cyclobacteriaceae bacterium]
MQHTTLRALAFLLATACVQPSKLEETKNDSLAIAVDESLLGLEALDSLTGLSLKVPKGVSDRSALLSESSVASGQLFSTDDQTLTVSLMSIDSLDKAFYQQFFNGTDSTINNGTLRLLNKAKIMINGLEVDQYIFQGPEVVNFKLAVYLPTDKVCEINYISARANYETNIKKIESSLGTIQYSF